MRPLKLLFVLFVGQLPYACNIKTEVKVTDITLDSSTSEKDPASSPTTTHSSFMTLQDWLFHLCDTERPDKSIVAYNFGLFETENGYSIYLIGSKEFDKNDSDWATNNDFEPNSKYYPLPADEYKSLKWEKVLAKIKTKLKDFTKTEKFKNSFFANAKAITTGFDDGDLERIK